MTDRLPPVSPYLHPQGHSHHLARPPRAVTPPPIAVRADEVFAAELAERMRRKAHNGSLGRCDELGCHNAATKAAEHNGLHSFYCAACAPDEASR